MSSTHSELNSLGGDSLATMPRRLLEMPDWAKVEEDYLRSVRNGRHPNSFKRKGELWYHCDATNQRLARVSKGHKLHTVLGESKYYCGEEHGDESSLSGQELQELALARRSSLDSQTTSGDSRSQSLGSGSAGGSRTMTPSQSKPNTAALKTPVKMSDADRAMIASVLGSAGDTAGGRASTLGQVHALGNGSPEHLRSLIDFQLNCVNIDVRYKSPLNYGQLVVIMNEANEVLCVDKRNAIRIKGKRNLAVSDKICFKMVDLRVMSNPSELRYGEPVWFQAVETPAPGASVDSNFFSSFVLGCKIFQLATIATQQLNENWANPKNKRREEIFKREEEADSDEEYDRRMEEVERKEREAKDAAEAANAPKSKGRGWGALKKAPVKETMEKVKKVDKKLAAKKLAEDLDEQADNKDLVGEVCGASIAVRLAHNTDGANVDQGMANEVVGKEALNLGLFVPLSAENARGADDSKMGSVLCSNRRIYLCQDLYCLANSMGSSYVPWPLHAGEFSKELLDPSHDSPVARHEAAAPVGGGAQAGTAAGGQALYGKALEQKKVRGKRGKRRENRDGEFGVLRRVVKRGEECEFNIDRKCVWRICHVDNLSDAHQMSTAELTTAKVMSAAKEKLRKSEIRRKGGKTYEGSHWMQLPPHPAEGSEDAGPMPAVTSPAKARIPGGEKFSLALRTDVSSHLLSKEAEILASRREKEQVLKGFVESQVSNWDPVGNEKFPEDVRSMRSMMSFEYIKPNVNVEIRPIGSDEASVGSLSQQASDEGDRARIMLPVGHEQAYSQSQSAILKKKTLGLRSYHYQQYPHFYKSPQKGAQSPMQQAPSPRTLSPLELSKTTFRKHFPFNAGLISPGERVLALRQAFDGIERHELDTLAANGGVDDSIEKRWKSTGEIAEVTEGKERPRMAEMGASRRNNSLEDADDEGRAEDESQSEAQRRLIIERKIQILLNEDDLMWAAAKHRRKIEAALLIEESMRNMDEEERKHMEEQLHVRRASMASMSSENALLDT